MEHDAGPWMISPLKSSKGGRMVVQKSQTNHCIADVYGTTAANARLVAAAPEMLALLQLTGAALMMRTDGMYDETVEAIRAVVARIEGRRVAHFGSASPQEDA